MGGEGGIGDGTAFVISPDSQLVAGIGPDQKGYLYPVAGGEPRVISGLNPGEQNLDTSFGYTNF